MPISVVKTRAYILERPDYDQSRIPRLPSLGGRYLRRYTILFSVEHTPICVESTLVIDAARLLLFISGVLHSTAGANPFNLTIRILVQQTATPGFWIDCVDPGQSLLRQGQRTDVSSFKRCYALESCRLEKAVYKQ